MMKPAPAQITRLLAVSPSTVGFGFAVMEGSRTLINWGVQSVRGSKNAECLKRVENLIVRYQPTVLVLRDQETKTSHRAPRIRVLNKRLAALGRRHKIRILLLSVEAENRAFFERHEGTKHERARFVAAQFPDELGPLLPSKRRPWENENPRMNIFDAAALLLVASFRKVAGAGQRR